MEWYCAEVRANDVRATQEIGIVGYIRGPEGENELDLFCGICVRWVK